PIHPERRVDVDVADQAFPRQRAQLRPCLQIEPIAPATLVIAEHTDGHRSVFRAGADAASGGAPGHRRADVHESDRGGAPRTVAHEERGRTAPPAEREGDESVRGAPMEWSSRHGTLRWKAWSPKSATA